MRLVINNTADESCRWAALYIAKRIKDFQPSEDRYFVLGLPTGGTPLKTYQFLIRLYENGELSFKYVKTFNMDEYVGLPTNHPQSYHTFMWKNFFDHIDIDPKNVNIPDGNCKDINAECELYERKIEQAGGIELFLGGIGSDGHIAFNEPGSSLSSKTRLKTLCKDTVDANSRFFKDVREVPLTAITVGVGTVLAAREVVVLITGSSKALALHMAIEEGVNNMWTVSALQLHPRLIIICDDDATQELKVKTVQYFKGLMEVHDQLIK